MNARHLDDEMLATLAFAPERADAASRAHAASCAECAGRLTRALSAFAELAPATEDDGASLVLGADAHARGVRDERERQYAGIGLAAALLVAVALVVSRLVGLRAPFASDVPHPVLGCAMTELAGGALGTAAAIAYCRRRLVHLDALRGSAVGALSATTMQLYLHLRCPEHALVHLFFGHVAVIGLVSLASALVAPRLSRVAAR